jgi:hypothetical protein
MVAPDFLGYVGCDRGQHVHNILGSLQARAKSYEASNESSTVQEHIM